jgi:TatD DNase family protein
VAKTLKKPLIIHTRSANDDALKVLKQEGAEAVGGVIHCFSEDESFAKQALALNFYISFSGIVTFKNAQTIQQVAKQIPEDRFLIETDSPYLAPVPFRGQSNTPLYLPHVAKQLAQLRGVEIEVIAKQSTANFHRLFATSC